MGRYPWAEILLFELLYYTVFYPTRRHVHRVVVLTVMVCIAARIYLTPEITSPLVVTYTVGAAIVLRFAFIAYLLCAEGTFPDHWKRVRDEVRGKAYEAGSDSPPSNFPLTKKLWWMLDLTYNARMIGRIQEPRNHLPPHPPPSRRTFLWKTFLKFIANGVLSDLTTSIFAGRPAFDSRVHYPPDGPETYLAAVPLLHRVPYIIGFGMRMATGISALHNIVALVFVGLGLSSPTVWPDMWGRWRDAYTVRKLWGRTWHQTLRPTFAGLGRLVANKFLKIPRGTNRSSYTQLYIAFFLSGVVHFAGDFMYEKQMVYRSFKFFLLQAAAITFEDLVIYMAKHFLIRGIKLKPGGDDESWGGAVVRVLGYCWVILWFCLTLPAWLDGASAAGLHDTDRGPITQFVSDTWRKRAWRI